MASAFREWLAQDGHLRENDDLVNRLKPAMMFSKKESNALRFLSVDAVEKARSGHPGMPLGMADIATVLWQKHLKHNPNNPQWFNRDRFVVSNGHGSMLLYALLHLTGYRLSLDELKHFRQLHSKTPGHPEYAETPGVETTTGPLGQGLANAVGMAIAEKVLSAEFNQEAFPLVDHHTYVFVGDGCLMEGISHEVASFAGTLGLGKLIVFYDDNGISIDGEVASWFSDDTAERFRAYHWQVIPDIDAYDFEAIDNAIVTAKADLERPTLIICQSVIGYGSPLAGSAQSHGAPLGPANIESLRKELNWPYPPFEIPDELIQAWNHTEIGGREEQQWLQVCEAYRAHSPQKYAEFIRRIQGDLPDHFNADTRAYIETLVTFDKAVATRKASQMCLEYLGQKLPELLGGSADLTESNNTYWSGCKPIARGHFNGNYLHYGVREFGMSAIMTGLALHGGFIPYGGTFLVFSDYARNAVRLCAMMKQRVIFVYTHDSIGLGEDGPTHQPIEHLAMLRMTPNLTLWRPADLVETAVAWQQALAHFSGPTCLVLSRQALPAQSYQPAMLSEIQKGAYILKEAEGSLQGILIATGSEVAIAMAAQAQLNRKGIGVRVVSMPCVEQFLRQETSYQEQILPEAMRVRVAIEAAHPAAWFRFVGLDGQVIGLDRFGVSAPGDAAYQCLGITVDKAVEVVENLIEKQRSRSQ